LGKIGEGGEGEGAGGRLVERHSRSLPPLVGEQWQWPRGLAGEGECSCGGFAPSRLGETTQGAVSVFFQHIRLVGLATHMFTVALHC
jgi:hypothetical protein